MSQEIDDIVAAISSEYKPLAIAGDKLAYAIKDEKEGKMLFDIFMAYGFEANLYNSTAASRLYIKQPTSRQLKKLPQAMLYARAYKSIKTVLDTLKLDPLSETKDYSMHLSGSEHGKQITINTFYHANSISSISSNPPFPTKNITTQAAVVSSSPLAPMAEENEPADGFSDEDFFVGPQVMRPTGRKRKFRPEPAVPDSYGKQLKTYVKGNAAGAISMAIIGIFLLVFVYSVLQMSKGFFCPDFAVADKDKNKSWYCK